MRGVNRNILLAAIAALPLALSGCASIGSTPYQPVSASNPAAGGFSDQRLDEGRYSVTFSGNRLTSRETVESYLLYRAAELTLEQGYDWFAIVDKQVEHTVDRQLVRDPLYDPWFASDYRYWRPYWRYYVPGTGWQSWYPYNGDPFWTSRMQTQTSERYEAAAEIRMGRGPMPATDVRAFDAHDVIGRIGPDVKRPQG